MSTNSNDSMFGRMDVRFLDLSLLMPAGAMAMECTEDVKRGSQEVLTSELDGFMCPAVLSKP